MTTSLANAAWPACLSALRLDRWMAGELGPGEAEQVRAHVAACERCRSAVAALGSARDVTLPPLRVTEALPASRRRAWRGRVLVPTVAALAAAAGLLLALRADAPAERVKGAGVGLAMYVLHDGVVRQAAPGEVVAPGDAVRFAVTTPEPMYVSVLSLDAAGRVSIYFPGGTRAERVEAGTRVLLPLATQLDATLGEERLVGLFCDRPVELEPVRRRLEPGSHGAIPDGCKVTRWGFVKR